jgi:sodium-dependent dicarboxylate transporter 2/3/5
MATLIGTPPNLIFAGAAKELAHRELSFADFLLVGFPIAAVLLPACWALLVFVLFRGRVDFGPEARRALVERRDALGPMRGGELRTVLVFLVTVAGWLLRERKEIGALTIPGLADFAPAVSDATVGLAGALLLFVVSDRAPRTGGRPLLTWREAREIPWEVLLLFGGGLSLAAAIESSGLARWLGEGVAGLAGSSRFLVYAGLAGAVVVLSELASNTAVAAMAMPIAAALAPGLGEPALALMLVAALAASAGFALPVATPPNAIVFGSGQVGIRQMAKAGVVLDLVAVVVVVLAVTILYPLVLD